MTNVFYIKTNLFYIKFTITLMITAPFKKLGFSKKKPAACSWLWPFIFFVSNI